MSQDRHPEYRQENSAGVVVDRHDDAYVDFRESLIPPAERAAVAAADGVVAVLPPLPEGATSDDRDVHRRAWERTFTSVFHSEMERLYRVTRGN